MVNLSPISLFVNSRNAAQTDNLTSNITMTLKNHLIVPRNIELHCRVLNAQIPISYYICNSNNNKLVYTIGGIQYTLTVPPGNYTAKQLVDQLNLNGISVSYDSKTNKMTFSASSDFTIDSATTIWELIGFSEGSKSSSNNLLISDIVCDFSGPNAIYLHSNLDNVHFGGKSNLLTKFPQNTAANGILNYTNKQNANHTIIKTRNLNILHFELRDEKANLIDLNSLHWECQILFTFNYIDIYDKTRNLDTSAQPGLFQGTSDFIYTHEIKKREDEE